jgi:F0F1-type ATP synthase epsilon subunit
VAMLKAGSTRVHVHENEVLEFATGPGFFKVEQDRALALVDDAVDAREIDSDRAQRQLEEARAELDRLEAGESDGDRWQLEQRLRHAENQLAVASGGPAGDRRVAAPPSG